MLKKLEAMWLENLGEITFYKHRIYFQPDSKPFKSPPFHAGPKARQLEKAEVENN